MTCLSRTPSTRLTQTVLRSSLRPRKVSAEARKKHSYRFLSGSTKAAPTEGGVSDNSAYCRDYVKKHDYESFLVSHFYPKHLQDAYFALKAFSVELATLSDTVSTPMIGAMKMQFWRDAVKAIKEGNPPRHPIALALLDASKRANLQSYHLKRMIDARETELRNPTHLTVDSLSSHAESISSTLNYLLLSLLDNPTDDASHAASHLGVAQTFTTLLRSLPFHASKGRMIIPAEITAKHGVNQEEVFRRGGEAKGIRDAVFEFATVANDHVITARDMFRSTGGKVPRKIMPVFLAGVPAASYLRRLESVDFDAFHPGLQHREWRLPWDIWKGYYKSTF